MCQDSDLETEEKKKPQEFWSAYERLRQAQEELGIEIDASVFEDVRDKTEGRTAEL